MTVRVLKMAGVAVPKRVMCRIRYQGSRLFSLVHYRVDFRFAVDVMAKREFCRAWRAHRYFRFVGDV